MSGFERLEVWQKALEYADTIYVVTRAFPDDERFGLIRQLRDASISISSNIAEGSSRSSSIEFKRFIEIAYGSLLETVSQLTVAKRQGFIGAQSVPEHLRASRKSSQNAEWLTAELKEPI